MAERKRITLVYQYDDNWIGGTYYILNIIRALKYLDEPKKPFITIIHDKKSSVEVIKNIAYPHLDFVKINLSFNYIQTYFNKLTRLLFGDPLIKKKIPGWVKNLYPVSDIFNLNNVENYYYWIPDFQELHLPHFFSKRQIYSRIRTHKSILKKNRPVVFSSQNALNDYNALYPHNNNKKVVLQFVSILDFSFKNIPINKLLEKSKIEKPFFIACNQFWKHKNHKIIIEAAKILKEKGCLFQVIFTGKEHDHRDPNYSKRIREMVNESGLAKDVLFLGFIDRQEQLQLMNNSVSIIQPSLFEGWSTVVEDSKALNKFIIVSDIPLHREQINSNAVFFDVDDSSGLAILMEEVLLSKFHVYNLDYKVSICDFALDFISIFDLY